ncbi:hypothetical protein N7535_001068 [Penicillium sp. DV-2018c]|nr:hypothetical protein N7461_005691 [Penicillium sp. DV-2018c]KAJ5582448.1 hypothetical protein N7535_001068 [Penicillium sp. DV-2018c]
MATQGTAMQANAADTSKLVQEHSHAFLNRLDTTQTDSFDSANPPPDGHEPKAATEVEPRKSAADTEPPVAEQSTETEEPTAAEAERVESSVGSVPPSHKPQETVGPMNETKVGEKRRIESTVAPVPAGTATKGPEPLEESGSKKVKTDEATATDQNGTTAAPSKAEDGKQAKDGRSKKEKIKDAVKKVIPGDGIGSRTRSRTK